MRSAAAAGSKPVFICGPTARRQYCWICGTTSLTALKRCGLDPGEVAAVFVSHLHGDHFGGLPSLIPGTRAAEARSASMRR
jgi:ribonuclease BN (tRNA processing enzyme)